MLALAGKAIEGDVLTAVEVIPKSETQQHVWGKYKKEVRYQWYNYMFCRTLPYHCFNPTIFFVVLK